MRIQTVFALATALLCFLVISSAASRTGAAEKESFVVHPAMTKFSKVAETVRDKCMSCHSRGFELPFYARIPGIKQIIEKDYNDGLRAMDLNAEFAEDQLHKPVSEATLAKMEWVMLNETMPPAKFAAVHWGARINSKEREEILDWVRMSRATYYAPGLAAPERANEPAQPIPDSLPTDAKKVALGEKLFHDKRLSGDNTLNCASCHDLKKAGTDNARFAKGVRDQFGDINAPTVFNAVFNLSQFWDGRAVDLSEQAGGPPFNPVEMDSADWNQIIGKLSKDEKLTEEFLSVYPQGWSGDGIMDAIAEYEKTLITPNSRFDKWLKGDDSAMSKAELEGYQRFKAYRCSSCHVGIGLGGQSYEYMNLKKDYFVDRGDPLGSDIGRKGFTKQEEDKHKFKVPNLRNIELTWPYMHDGTVTTLNDAVHTMGTYLSGMDIPQSDKDLIVAFLRSLTGEYQGKKVEGVPVAK